MELCEEVYENNQFGLNKNCSIDTARISKLVTIVLNFQSSTKDELQSTHGTLLEIKKRYGNISIIVAVSSNLKYTKSIENKVKSMHLIGITQERFGTTLLTM